MYAIVDVETTGGYAGPNRITEIAIYVFDGKKIVEEFSTLINPEKYIPPAITLLTGISNEMVASAPRFSEVALQIKLMTQDLIFVAHNVGFDYSFLRKEFKNLGERFIRKKLCTVRLARKIIPGLHSYGLGNLCRAVHIPIKNRHRAFGDAKATVALFKYLLQNDRENHIEYALDRTSREGTLPPNLLRDDFDQLPEETGVYYFLDKKGKVIYVGKAKNMRNRVISHFINFGKSPRSMEFRNEIHNLSHEVCGNELIALLLESQDIKKYWPKFNRSQRWSEACWGIHRYEDQQGYWRLQVAKTKVSDGALITFKQFDHTWEYLKQKTREHLLCPKLCNLQKPPKNCLEYQTQQCRGACIGEEPPVKYNGRVAEAIENFKHLNNSFLILGQGRQENESSLVVVDKGRYLGFGYASDIHQETSIEGMKNCITRYKDNQDVQRILSNYLGNRRSNQGDKILKI